MIRWIEAGSLASKCPSACFLHSGSCLEDYFSPCFFNMNVWHYLGFCLVYSPIPPIKPFKIDLNTEPTLVNSNVLFSLGWKLHLSWTNGTQFNQENFELDFLSLNKSDQPLGWATSLAFWELCCRKWAPSPCHTKSPILWESRRKFLCWIRTDGTNSQKGITGRYLTEVHGQEGT